VFSEKFNKSHLLNGQPPRSVRMKIPFVVLFLRTYYTHVIIHI